MLHIKQSYFHCNNCACHAYLPYFVHLWCTPHFTVLLANFWIYEERENMCVCVCVCVCVNDVLCKHYLSHILDKQKRVAENSGPLGYHSLSVEEWFLMFQRYTVLPGPWRWRYYVPSKQWEPLTQQQCYIPEGLDPQQHSSENLTSSIKKDPTALLVF